MFKVFFILFLAASLSQTAGIVFADQDTKQVQIESKFVEVNRDFARDLGVDWDTKKEAEIREHEDINADISRGIEKKAIDDQSISKFGDNIGVNFSLEELNIPATLEKEAASKIVKNPVIQTVTDKPAVTVVHTQIPANTTQPVVLKTTPQVNPDGSIGMDVKPETQLLDSTSLPIQNIQTTVLVPDGQTVVLGGLATSEVKSGGNKVPVLGDIPVMGELFKSKNKDSKKKDLMVFITPTIVNPSEEQ